MGLERRSVIKAWGGALAALALLGACDAMQAPAPPIVAATQPPQDAAIIVRPTSPESAALRAYFSAVQSSQLRQGLLRRDGGGVDTPYTAQMLARNFEQIAFFDEFASDGRSAGGEAVLRRWDGPVHVHAVFGDAVSLEQRLEDKANLDRFVARLARVTGHPVRMRRSAPNFIVLFAGEDDRPEALRQIEQRLGVRLAALESLSRDTYCAVVAFGADSGSATYSAAVALIRAENPSLLRLSCIHEEVAQGLGLPNDSPFARPSIFNDDDEFALLTRHDEQLLSLLYDPALTPGQSREEARATVLRIARARTGEEMPKPGS